MKNDKLIDGKALANTILQELANEVTALKKDYGTPSVVFIRVGDDPASVSYVNMKRKAAHTIGIESQLIELPTTVTQEEVFQHIDRLNKDSSVNGILIQAPLPKHLSEVEIFNRVSTVKDVDGFSALNLGKLCQEQSSGFIACTPLGILELLKRSNITIQGKHVVIMGKSLIVGKPAGLTMLREGLEGDATITICHAKSQDIQSYTQKADILIVAIGKPKHVTKDYIKKGAVVIDVGINRVIDKTKPSGYSLVGDVDFDDLIDHVSKITPVPGGVGPMTVAMLMKNTVKAYRLQNIN